MNKKYNQVPCANGAPSWLFSMHEDTLNDASCGVYQTEVWRIHITEG